MSNHIVCSGDHAHKRFRGRERVSLLVNDGDGESVLVCPSTDYVINIPVFNEAKYQTVSERILRERFAVQRITAIIHAADPESDSLPYEFIEGVKHWRLILGGKYNVVGGEPEIPNVVVKKEKDEDSRNITVLSDDSGDDDHDVKEVDGSLKRLCNTEFPKTLEHTYRISAFDTILKVKGCSQLARFVQTLKFEVEQVDKLPNNYNGDIIFELPPIDGRSQGAGLKDMDRDQDCYNWGRMINTTAKLPKKNEFRFGFRKVVCQGSLECRNGSCPSFCRTGVRNAVSWKGKSKLDRRLQPGRFVGPGELQCGHCDAPPFIVESCPAMMFYMYGLPGIEVEIVNLMSRLAIHVGSRNHPPQMVFSRDSVSRAENAIKKEIKANPSATPSKIKNSAIGSLMTLLHPKCAIDLLEEDEAEVWESVLVLGTKQKFTALLRSVRINNKNLGEMDAIQYLVKNVKFLFVLCLLFPGQGSSSQRCYIFKMSILGDGCGLDLLKRQRKGGDLYGSWVSLDITHQISSGWLTFSAHVYDHIYRALCTIFTYELKLEDHESLETAWKAMMDVAHKNEVDDVYIHGFTADNLQAGWIAVRNVFFDGIPHPVGRGLMRFTIPSQLQLK